MKLAFNGKAHYTDFDKGYELYVSRSRKGECFDKKTYNRVIRLYCKKMAERLLDDGFVDLPAGLGMITAAEITRKPQYRGKTFVGYGKMDWKTGHRDGKLKTFGMVYLPRRGGRKENLRSYGYVANRALFKKMKSKYDSPGCSWALMEFNDEMI